MPFSGRSPLEYPANSNSPIRRFIKNRAPTASDYKQFKISDMWLHSDIGSGTTTWYICAYKDSTKAVWEQFVSSAGKVESLTGDVGLAVTSDALDNINIVGGAGVTTTGDPATNTVTVALTGGGLAIDSITGDSGDVVAPDALGNVNYLGNSGTYLNGIAFTGDLLNNTITAKNLRNITSYVVDPVAGETEYTTIQSALDAANAAGGNATVYVRNGTYTEDLTFYDGINLVGASGLGDEGQVEIIGKHTPPATGNLVVRNFKLTSATDIFSSTDAGTSHLVVIDAALAITDGYLFNLANWTATGILECFDINSASSSTENGGVYNTGGCQVYIYNAGVGFGSTKTMTLSGTTEIFGSDVLCPISFQGTGSSNIDGGLFNSKFTTSDTHTLGIYNARNETGAVQAITHNSGSTLILSSTTINSSNNPAIGGTGTIEVTGVDFVDNSSFAATLTVTGGKSISGSAKLLDRTENTLAYYSTDGEVDELAAMTDGQLVLGSTGASPSVSDLTSSDGTITFTSGAGTLDLSASGASLIDEQNIIYVGKHGNDANDGLNIEKAKLTFGGALAVAASGDVIKCFDAGVYVEDITGVAGVDFYAGSATISGSHTVAPSTTWRFNRAIVATGTNGFVLNSTGNASYIRLARMEIAGTGNGLISLAGSLFCEVERVLIENGFLVGSLSADTIQCKFEEIIFSGTGTAFGTGDGGELHVLGNSVENDGVAGDGQLFFTTGVGSPLIDATISHVHLDKLSNLTATTEARLNVSAFHGTEAETGAGNVIIGGATRIDGVQIGANIASTGEFSTLGVNSAYDFPTTDGTADQVLTTDGSGAVTWQDGGSSTAVESVPTDSGTATPSTGALTLAGGTNIGTTGAGSTATVNLDDEITLTKVNATTFDTNVAAAGATLSGTTLAADGTDANISLTLTAKGTGTVNPSALSVNSAYTFPTADGTADQVLTTDGAGAVTWETNSSTGILVQEVSSSTSSRVTCSTALLGDDTIPQNTEGDEVLTVTITPKSATNLLLIEFNTFYSVSTAQSVTAGLFQDSTAGAISSSVLGTMGTAGYFTNSTLRHKMTAGTTSSTTFKIRVGCQVAPRIVYINGSPTARVLGGTASTWLTVKEIATSTGVTTAFTWITVTANTTLAVNTGYMIKHATSTTQLVCTLPTTAAVGDTIQIAGNTSGGWKLAQNASQTVYFGNTTTTTGTSGSLESTDAKDTVELVCITANNDWQVLDVQGSLTVN
jgi:hypothetical protein